jgi:bifunctional non-homologous end joining protein LigD
MQRARLEDLPRFVEPMLPISAPAPTSDDWAMEVKWDGMRAQLRFDGRAVCVRSRTGRDCTGQFPELAQIAEQLQRLAVILDGELVCFGPEGKPDFPALRTRLVQRDGQARTPAEHTSATLVVFDVLHLTGRAVRELLYAQRRELLAELALAGPAWQTPQHFIGQGEALLAATAEQGLEGVVAKRLDGRYAEGRRSRAWVKQKHRRRERLLVTGWRERIDELPEFLLARRAADGGLRPAGSASLGLDPPRRTRLLEALEQHETAPRRPGRSVHWAAPVVEVIVDHHGPTDGPARDPVLREILLRDDDDSETYRRR